MTRLAVIIMTLAVLVFGYATGLGAAMLPALYPRTNSGAGTFLIVLGITSCIAIALLCRSSWRLQALAGVVFIIGWMPVMGAITEEVAKRP